MTQGQCERCGVETEVTLEEYPNNPSNLWYLCERCKQDIRQLSQRDPPSDEKQPTYGESMQ